MDAFHKLMNFIWLNNLQNIIETGLGNELSGTMLIFVNLIHIFSHFLNVPTVNIQLIWRNDVQLAFSFFWPDTLC